MVYCRGMSRRPAPLTPRKVAINGGQVRWEVRIPTELRKQEGGTRRFFAKEAVAKGFCNRLASDAPQLLGQGSRVNGWPEDRSARSL